MTKLVLQILGETDISVDSHHGKKEFQGEFTLEDMKEAVQSNDQKLINDLGRVDFPLIREIQEKQPHDDNLCFGIILTDQTPWLQAQEKDLSPEAWMEYIASDGIWWKNVLNAWCEQQGISWFPIHLQIHQENNGEDNGVADWEKMARLIQEKLHNLVNFQQETISVSPPEGNNLDVDEILIQHSSGTPALSGALYLWGIEQKLAEQNVEFAYLSKENTNPFHSGDQWQWRFKAPQIRQLLDIQDFAGAEKLLRGHFSENLTKKVEHLDRAVSFNLVELEGIDQNAKEKVIERIAIALWSERAFRERGQWMHWYLRVAGAFELALRCLVESQGEGKYWWEQIDPNILRKKNNDQPQDNPPSILVYKDNHKKRDFSLPISVIVFRLLTKGNAQETKNDQTINHQIDTIKNPNWNQFKAFYCDKGWDLSDESQKDFFQTGFNTVRNELYHFLQGDQIDKYLDKKTNNLKSITHDEHPAEIAVKYLRYINQLAEINKPVQDRVKYYQSKVKEVKDSL